MLPMICAYQVSYKLLLTLENYIMLKQILIPVALFAVTVTNASAFNGDLMSTSHTVLRDSRIETMQEVKTIRQNAKQQIAELLRQAGIDKAQVKETRHIKHDAHKEQRTAMKTALDTNDYEAFKIAVVGSHLADTITTEADFEKMVDAQQLLKVGDRKGAKAIFDELGIKGPGHFHKGILGSHKGQSDRF